VADLAGTERFSLKDHLFNAESIGDLAAEYAAAWPDFDAERFTAEVLAGFPGRELMQRLDWIADCLEPSLPAGFPAMAEALEAAMPPPLDPTLTDDDFGRFIHAVPGIIAVRHGLEGDRDRALDLLHEATQRFSMEFYIRPFLNRWPEETLARLSLWAGSDNYHVRRLVSEGTRPKLPWARAVDLSPERTLPLLDRLHADRARYVTRSVANHLNDLTKTVPDRVIAHLEDWQGRSDQTAKELDWMTRHALRTQVKAGAPQALRLLGFDPDAALEVGLSLVATKIRIGETLDVAVTLTASKDTPVIVDYVLFFPTASGKTRQKTFKLKQSTVPARQELRLTKAHKLKANATTFALIPGPHRIEVQVNGRIRAKASFDLIA